MNYITPDEEIKRAFQKLEAKAEINSFVISGFNLYGITRFYLEMRYRIAYFEKINSDSSFKNNKNVIGEISSNFFIKYKNKIKKKWNNYKEDRIVKKYYDQFDEISNFDDNIDTVFIATSGFKNSKNYSIELNDLIKHEIEHNQKITFVLPNYDLKIKRKKEYKYFYSIDLNKKIEYNVGFEETINKYKSYVAYNLPLLNKDDIDGIRGAIYYQIGLSNQLSCILEKIKPKYVIGRSLYSDKWVVMAAAKNAIKVIEIQHGVFTDNNFYYHSIGKLGNKDLLIPDFVLCLGSEWLKILRTQSENWDDKNSGIIGTSTKIEKTTNKSKVKNILISFQDFSISVFDIRAEIYSFLESYANEFKEYNFIIRVHPADKLSDLPDFSEIKNVILSDPKSETTGQVLAKSDLLICATSMMMYEALNFKIPVISFERFRKMTQETSVYFINSSNDLYTCLKEKKYEVAINLNYLNDLNFSFYDSITKNK